MRAQVAKWKKNNPDKAKYDYSQRPWTRLMISCRSSCSIRGKKGKDKASVLSITERSLYEMWESQHHRCHWTGAEMTLQPGTDRSISVDRLDVARGYEPGNFVLCCRWVNFARASRTPEETASWLRDVVIPDIGRIYTLLHLSR